MKLALEIAKRYLYAKKSQNIINVISMISVIGVLTGSMALVVVLSIFNGLHNFMGDLYSTFDPDLKLTPVSGKVFSLDSIPIDQIKNTPGVEAVAEVLEDQALLRFGKRQMPGMIMGVDSVFNQVSGIDSIIVDGKFQLKHKSENRGIIGQMLADQLALRLNFVRPMTLYVPRRKGSISMMNAQSAFRKEFIQPSGIFMVKQEEYDGQYVIVGIDQARRLFQYSPHVVSSLTVKAENNTDIDALEERLQDLCGEQISVLNRQEQHAAFNKLIKVEKLMGFLIMSFILVIAAFNIVASLSLLIFEKKESIFTLKSMGASQKLITRIFLIEGWLISFAGVLGGTLLGIILVLIQLYFGVIKFGGSGTYIVEAYPVALQLFDIIASLITVSTISFLAAWYPVKVIVKRYYQTVNL